MGGLAAAVVLGCLLLTTFLLIRYGRLDDWCRVLPLVFCIWLVVGGGLFCLLVGEPPDRD